LPITDLEELAKKEVLVASFVLDIEVPIQGESTRCTAGVGDPASKERLSEIASGSSRGQQGLRNNLQRLLERG